MRGQPKNLAKEKRAKKFLRTPLEIDFGFSNSIFAAFGGAGRQLWVNTRLTDIERNFIERRLAEELRG